jgi:nucleosome binding factor SPN SPT16 subunit
VKKMAMVYITEAVTSAKIPTIKGTKDWGTYDIIGVQINKLDITQDSLEVVISRVITVNVSDVSADLADFDFKYDKTTFPKIQDAGKASAQVVDLSSVIEFEIIVDEQGKLTVDNVKASIKIGALLVDVSNPEYIDC